MNKRHLKVIPVECEEDTALDELLHYLREASCGEADISVEDGNVKITEHTDKGVYIRADLRGLLEDVDRDMLYDEMAFARVRVFEEALASMKEES